MPERTKHRSLTERWVVTGTLTLETPAHFGSGEADALMDMPILLNEVDDKPLLPGTSIAGALRSYLREMEAGYGNSEAKNSLVSLLFGSSRASDEGAQSPLIVDDAVGISAGFELRDGVAIDAETRTAADDKKFDMQLLAADSTFDLRFELLVSKKDNSTALRNALFTALTGLGNGEITLGARKQRGFGQVTVKNWQVWQYDLTSPDGLLDWLGSEQGLRKREANGNLSKLSTTIWAKEQDKRASAHLSATFTLDGTLMIRSGFGESDSGPDMVHLHSQRDGKKVPVIPGTSWAGVLRHRALKIARTLSMDNQPISQTFVDGMFGPSEIKGGDKNAKASRVSIKESEITGSTSLVVTRVKIDRFTGGAFESALFTEQPAIGKLETRLILDLTLRKKAKHEKPDDAEKSEKEFQTEIGLLLLLLKDLWMGDLPVGGESGIGRGRLKGVCATLTTPNGEWTFVKEGEKIKVTPEAESLEELVTIFNQAMKAQVPA